MRELNSLDYKLMFELMKNSRRSDRTLAKALNSSQPTITRRRVKLEKDFLDGYTAVPRWKKIGFEVIVFTFIKSKLKYAGYKERKAAFQRVREWFGKQPNVIFSTSGEGMGWNGLTVSIHESYSDYMKFKRKHDSELGDLIDESQTFISHLDRESIAKPLHLKYLAETKQF